MDDICEAMMVGRYELTQSGFWTTDENGVETFVRVEFEAFFEAVRRFIYNNRKIDDDEIIRENRRNGYYVEAEGKDEFTFFFSGWWGYEEEFETLNGMRRMCNYSWETYPHVQRMDGWEDFIVIETLAGNLPKYNEELYGMFPELRRYREEEEYCVRMFLHGDWTVEAVCRLLTENGKFGFGDATWTDENGEEHAIRNFEDYYEYYDYVRQ